MRKLMVISMLISVGRPLPASAHPVITGEATTGDIVLLVIGGAMSALGLALAVLARKRHAPGQRSRLLGRASALMIILGLLIVMAGPSLLPGESSSCNRPTSTARIAILSPSQGEVLTSTEVPVEVDLDGASFAQSTSTQNQPNEGHLHLTVDGRLASMTGSSEQTLELAPGDHTISAEFVANDHAPFCTRVADQVQISVQPE